jgi:hypothetical protein
LDLPCDLRCLFVELAPKWSRIASPSPFARPLAPPPPTAGPSLNGTFSRPYDCSIALALSDTMPLPFCVFMNWHIIVIQHDFLNFDLKILYLFLQIFIFIKYSPLKELFIYRVNERNDNTFLLSLMRYIFRYLLFCNNP